MTPLNSLVKTIFIVASMMLVISSPVQSQEGMGNSAQDSNQTQEIVILVDNSSGMQSVDPLFLVRSDVADFTSILNQESYISLMLFDGNVKTLIPLSPSRNTDSLEWKNILENITYTGISSDLVMAIERAVYELNFTGQKGVQKFIVIISGGNNLAVDSAETVRPDEALIAALSNSNIEIHAVAISDKANLQTLQVLGGQSTLRRHFVPEIAELGDTLNKINQTFKSRLKSVPVQESQRQSQGGNTSGISAQVTNPGPNQSGQSTSLGTEERTRTLLIITAAIVLFTTLIILIILLFIQYRKFTKKPDFAESDAYLRDVQGRSGRDSFQLGKKATMLGRVAGKDTSNIDYIVIPEPTIGRRHAVIEYKDYGYWITDQGSINGTFVNDIPINSEIRLKHGDIIKLHKFEFEFAIPELEDSTMTKVSDTVIAHGSAYAKPTRSSNIDIESIKSSMSGDGSDLDFDLSSSADDATQQPEKDDDSEDTLAPDYESTLTQARVKTINPNDHLSNKISGKSDDEQASKEPKKEPWDDLTIVPGQDNSPDEK